MKYIVLTAFEDKHRYYPKDHVMKYEVYKNLAFESKLCCAIYEPLQVWEKQKLQLC